MPLFLKPNDENILPATARWQKKKKFIIFSYAVTLGFIALIGLVISIFIPEILSKKLMDEYISERAESWGHEMSELNIPNQTSYINHTLPTKDDEIWLRYLAKAGEIYHVTLLNNNFEPFWSTDNPKGSKRLNEKPLSERSFEHQIGGNIAYFTFAVPEVLSIESNQGMLEDPSKAGSGLSNAEAVRVAEVIVPYRVFGKTLGYIAMRYNVDHAFTWYQTNIKLAFTAVFCFAFLTALISFIVNITIHERIGATIAKNEEKNLALEAAEKSKIFEMSSMKEFSEWLHSSRSREEYQELLKNFIAQLFPDYRGSLYLYDEDHTNLNLAGSWENDGIELEQMITVDSCWAIRRGRPYHYGNQQISLRCNHNDVKTCEHYICLPILANGETLGSLTLAPIDDQIALEEFNKTVEMATKCVDQMSMSLSNITLRERLEEQAIIDPLTTLYNRRGFYKHLETMLTLHKSGFTLAIIDLDHFKRFNDQYGHDAGDEVLRAVSALLKDMTHNKAYRLGGEEMAFFFADEYGQNANKFVEDIRESISKLVINCNGKELPKVTGSIGVAAFPSDTHKTEALLKLADTALYQAKEKGRNCVVWHKDLAKDVPYLEISE